MSDKALKIESLRRVVIVGTSCSGKTTLGKSLSQLLNVKRIEMDAINWLPNWTQRPDEDFRSLVEREIIDESWVLDGNYSRVRDLVWRRATAIIWLNYPFRLVAYRALARTTRRVFTREVLYSENRETFRKAFMSTDSILVWVLKSYHRHRRNYSKLLKENEHPGKEIFIFHTPHETQRFLRQVESLKHSDKENID